jgi:hemerythrin
LEGYCCRNYPVGEDDVTPEKCKVLELGIETIDSEHRDLARLLDEFAKCICDGDPEGSANEIVGRAIDCANVHFEHEEELAAAANYAKIDEEKFQHRNLRLQFTTLIGDIKARDPIAIEHLIAMRTLLEEHISGPDRELADFLKAAGLK